MNEKECVDFLLTLFPGAQVIRDDTIWPKDKKATTLEKHVENLLRSGKRSKDPEFQHLFGIYTEKRITEMALAFLERMKQEKTHERKS